MTFPSAHVCQSLVPAGRLAFLEVRPIPDMFVTRWTSHAGMIWPAPPVTLGGGCIAGDRTAWAEFGEAYEATIKEFDAVGRFAGKDQIVYFAMLIERKTSAPFRLVGAQVFANGTGDHWMSMPVILGEQAPAIIDNRFEPV